MGCENLLFKIPPARGFCRAVFFAYGLRSGIVGVGDPVVDQLLEVGPNTVVVEGIAVANEQDTDVLPFLDKVLGESASAVTVLPAALTPSRVSPQKSVPSSVRVQTLVAVHPQTACGHDLGLAPGQGFIAAGNPLIGPSGRRFESCLRSKYPPVRLNRRMIF